MSVKPKLFPSWRSVLRRHLHNMTTQIVQRSSIHFPWGGHGDSESLRQNYDAGRINVGDWIISENTQELVHEVISPENDSPAGIFIRYLCPEEIIREVRYSPAIPRILTRACVKLVFPSDVGYKDLRSELQKAGLA